MDPELKASMENILRMAAPRQNQESTTILEPSLTLTTEELERKHRNSVIEKISGRVPRMFRDADIKNCGIDYPQGSLFITGKAGTGKTYLGIAILKEAIYRYIKNRESWSDYDKRNKPMPSWIWETVPELLLELRGAFKEKANYTEQDVIKDYSEPDLLILDDLGAEKSSEFTIQSLYLIIDRRYSSELRTIITSNLSLGEISEKVGDRIASRIAGMCKVVELKGKDRRLSK